MDNAVDPRWRKLMAGKSADRYEHVVAGEEAMRADLLPHRCQVKTQSAKIKK